MSTLFIGNFFLSKPGTKSISQKLVKKLESEKIKFIIGSKSKNKVLRIFEIIFKTLFYNYKNRKNTRYIYKGCKTWHIETLETFKKQDIL